MELTMGSSSQWRLRLAEAGIPLSALLFPLIATPPSLIWLAGLPFGLDWWKAGLMALNWAVLAGYVLFCARSSRSRTLTAIIASITIITFGLAAVSLPTSLPFFGVTRLWDDVFLSWDHAIGINHTAMLSWFASNATITNILHFLYFSTAIMVIGAAVTLIALRRHDRLHELLWLFVWTLAAVTVIAAFVPAKGLFSGLGLNEELRSALPPQSGDYHLVFVERLISGLPQTLDIAANPGVVVFPSFHFCMAFLLAWAFRGIRHLAFPSTCISALIMISIVPIGGHYVVDALASFPVLLAMLAAHRALVPQKNPVTGPDRSQSPEPEIARSGWA
jgi:hypothetical protein